MLDRPNRFHVAALVVATVLASCRPQPAADNADNVAANTMLPKIPAVEAPQNRQDILLHVMRAASAATRTAPSHGHARIATALNGSSDGSNARGNPFLNN